MLPECYAIEELRESLILRSPSSCVFGEDPEDAVEKKDIADGKEDDVVEYDIQQHEEDAYPYGPSGYSIRAVSAVHEIHHLVIEIIEEAHDAPCNSSPPYQKGPRICEVLIISIP